MKNIAKYLMKKQQMREKMTKYERNFPKNTLNSFQKAECLRNEHFNLRNGGNNFKSQKSPEYQRNLE